MGLGKKPRKDSEKPIDVRLGGGILGAILCIILCALTKARPRGRKPLAGLIKAGVDLFAYG